MPPREAHTYPPIETLIRQRIDAYHADLEAACETALQGGACGVLVTHKRDGNWYIRVDPGVPYGEIYERLPHARA